MDEDSLPIDHPAMLALIAHIVDQKLQFSEHLEQRIGIIIDNRLHELQAGCNKSFEQ